ALGRSRNEAARPDCRDRIPPGIAPPWGRILRKLSKGVGRIVRNEPAPDQSPKRIDGFRRVAAANGLVQRPKERRAANVQEFDDRGVAAGEVRLKRVTSVLRVRLERDMTSVLRVRLNSEAAPLGWESRSVRLQADGRSDHALQEPTF